MKSRMIKAVIIIAVVLISLFLFRFCKNVYEYSYFKELGIPGIVSYEKLIQVKGKPIQEYEEGNGDYVVKYDGFTYFYLNNRCNSRIEIHAVEYRFGREKIGVGSTREEVEHAYKGIRKIQDLPQNNFGVIDGWRKSNDLDPWVVYVFDENNIVIKILIYHGP